ncbi:hypothetical protein NLU13_3792 [Sarocladium strictum]|uniref:Uncharacterized protein n=1 Tax=Sarocladium strictum TaxID=5046 RepID=A0AA39GI18_SARSR|nr:hypothetical protein NLU13_3792 [Sarocladium strictum]
MAHTNERIKAAARKVRHASGFGKTYNLCLFILTAGALFGFVLARLQYLNIDGVYCKPGDSGALPGECLLYSKPSLERVGIILHLGGILPAGFLVCFQFVPKIRQKIILVHRINGYAVLLLSIVGTVGALMIARKAVGGSIPSQTIIGVYSIYFLGCLTMGYISVKKRKIAHHRAWMLRAWVSAGAIITTRPIMIIVAVIISPNSYWVVRSCEAIAYMVDDPSILADSYPYCAAYVDGQNRDQVSPVRARLAGASNPAEVAAALEIGFVTGLWLAFLIHVALLELYFHLKAPAEQGSRGAEPVTQSVQKPRDEEMDHNGHDSANIMASNVSDTTSKMKFGSEVRDATRA